MTIIQSSYLTEAFGAFDQDADPDAAVKFCLNIVAMDRRFPALAELLSDQGGLGGFGGDPGWSLERRRGGASAQGYEHWPPGTAFYACEFDYPLGFPEQYYTATAFCSFVRAILKAYVARHPNRAGEVEHVAFLLQG